MKIRRRQRGRRRPLHRWGLAAVLVCLSGPSSSLAAPGPPQWLSVAVLEGKVYPRPDRTTAPLTILPYATRVEALERAGPPDLLQWWVRVRPSESAEASPSEHTKTDAVDLEGDSTGASAATGAATSPAAAGWMLSTVLDARELVRDLEGDQKAIRRVAKQNQALAGRSFEDEVERRLTEGDGTLASATLQLEAALADRESLAVSDLDAFRREGSLPPFAATGAASTVDPPSTPRDEGTLDSGEGPP